ncbi:DUF1990 domain-containing protein [Brachybacterium sp. NBEC-018]|uniref:DUF1990 domain-containing protein n=1 Tax=Brachybacterium sp. NBEC-018 TaxID=2996004 RepID=UPI002174F48B|nr:DUF1990 domain-containing protein [Brachybacterium sp. NBEC-018]UVY83765.1 DUF1990 domain-containing protein [Brachybacterium sp. NBEC-018]
MARAREVTWDHPGVTAPDSDTWPVVPREMPGRVATASRVIGNGEECWKRASADLLGWAVKTRSGFSLAPDTGPPAPGQELTIIARLGPLRVREPAQVLEVVHGEDRVALSYTTRQGHPVRGEEAFILHRARDGAVVLTLRSVTAAARGRYRPLFPVALVLQQIYRRRYLRSLR